MNKKSEIIQAELVTAAQDYLSAKVALEEARLRMDFAREKLATANRIAKEILAPHEYRTARPKDIRFAGIPIGEAITAGLREEAVEYAEKFLKGEEVGYMPWLQLHGIVQRLDEGGYEFSSATPLREVNGALLKLATVTKVPNGYQVADAEEIFQEAKRRRERRERQRGEGQQVS